MINIKVGGIFPKFISNTFRGKKVQIPDDFKDRYLVLYFYPKDMTSGCTTEGIEFSKLIPDFEKVGTSVIGISVDSPESHEKFCNANNLAVTLLTDKNGELGNKIGILRESGSHERTTFILDKSGKIIKIYESVAAGGHASKVLDFLKEN